MKPERKKLMGTVVLAICAVAAVFFIRYVVVDIIRMNNESDPHTFRIIGGSDAKRMETLKEGTQLPMVFVLGADWTTRGKLYYCAVDQATYDWAERLAGVEIEIPIRRCMLLAPKPEQPST